MGSTPISEYTIVVGGLPVHVFSSAADGPLDSLTGKVALLFFLHGRQGSAAQVARVVQDFFDKLSGLNTGKGKDIKLLVATYVSTLVPRFYLRNLLDS